MEGYRKEVDEVGRLKRLNRLGAPYQINPAKTVMSRARASLGPQVVGWVGWLGEGGAFPSSRYEST